MPADQQPWGEAAQPLQGAPHDVLRPLAQVRAMPVLARPPQAPPARDLPTGGPRLTPRHKLANRMCPVCRGDVHAGSDGKWACDYCGSSGGTFKGKGMYVTARGDATKAAQPPKLGRSARRRNARHARRTRR